MTMKSALTNGLKTGLALTAGTSAAILLASARERGQPWAAINAVTHIIDGDEVVPPEGWSPRSSLLGLGINAAAMGTWGVLYEGVLAVTHTRSRGWIGSLGASVAYLVDYGLVPQRLRPGIETRLSRGSVLAIYLVLASILAHSHRWTKQSPT
jgi:hypothetical protein